MTFATKGGGQRTLPGVELLRCFVDHLLPGGLHAHQLRRAARALNGTTTLEQARALLTPTRSNTSTTMAELAAARTSVALAPTWGDRLLALTDIDAERCPRSVVMPATNPTCGVAARSCDRHGRRTVDALARGRRANHLPVAYSECQGTTWEVDTRNHP